jgi:hypothetical protein
MAIVQPTDFACPQLRCKFGAELDGAAELRRLVEDATLLVPRYP